MIKLNKINHKNMTKHDINARLESIAWALFLIMLGVLWLFPEGRFPEDTWLLGVGAILLLLNMVRYLYRIKMSTFTIILGIIALAAGLDDYIGFELPIIPILVITVGVIIIIRPKWFKCKRCDKWLEE